MNCFLMFDCGTRTLAMCEISIFFLSSPPATALPHGSFAPALPGLIETLAGNRVLGLMHPVPCRNPIYARRSFVQRKGTSGMGGVLPPKVSARHIGSERIFHGKSDMLNRKATILAAALIGATFTVASADEFSTTSGVTRKSEPISLDAGPSPSLERKPTAQELIQARAWQRHLDREAILRANAWAGYEPLRPNLPANPFTQAHYPIYRPYHIWSVYDYVTIR